jgi:hypothetical protein
MFTITLEWADLYLLLAGLFGLSGLFIAFVVGDQDMEHRAGEGFATATTFVALAIALGSFWGNSG